MLEGKINYFFLLKLILKLTEKLKVAGDEWKIFLIILRRKTNIHQEFTNYRQTSIIMINHIYLNCKGPVLLLISIQHITFDGLFKHFISNKQAVNCGITMRFPPNEILWITNKMYPNLLLGTATKIYRMSFLLSFGYEFFCFSVGIHHKLLGE